MSSNRLDYNYQHNYSNPNASRQCIVCRKAPWMGRRHICRWCGYFFCLDRKCGGVSYIVKDMKYCSGCIRSMISEENEQFEHKFNYSYIGGGSFGAAYLIDIYSPIFKQFVLKFSTNNPEIMSNVALKWNPTREAALWNTFYTAAYSGLLCSNFACAFVVTTEDQKTILVTPYIGGERGGGGPIQLISPDLYFVVENWKAKNKMELELQTVFDPHPRYMKDINVSGNVKYIFIRGQRCAVPIDFDLVVETENPRSPRSCLCRDRHRWWMVFGI